MLSRFGIHTENISRYLTITFMSPWLLIALLEEKLSTVAMAISQFISRDPERLKGLKIINPRC